MTEDTNATWWDGLSQRQRIMLVVDAGLRPEIAYREWSAIGYYEQISLVAQGFLHELI